ncbi:MAG: hypothetical protein PWQ70_3346 [Clostridiales bacterium]|nr:hypothetical protein [Clostridiales bacterium]
MAKETNGKEITLKDNEVLINGKKREILGTKIKYLKNGYFNAYKIINDIGIVELFNYSDGEELIKNFLISVFDDENYVNSVFEDLDVETIENIIEVVKKVNKIKEEDFLTKMMREEVKKEE